MQMVKLRTNNVETPLRSLNTKSYEKWDQETDHIVVCGMLSQIYPSCRPSALAALRGGARFLRQLHPSVCRSVRWLAGLFGRRRRCGRASHRTWDGLVAQHSTVGQHDYSGLVIAHRSTRRDHRTSHASQWPL